MKNNLSNHERMVDWRDYRLLKGAGALKKKKNPPKTKHKQENISQPFLRKTVLSNYEKKNKH